MSQGPQSSMCRASANIATDDLIISFADEAFQNASQVKLSDPKKYSVIKSQSR